MRSMFRRGSGRGSGEVSLPSGKPAPNSRSLVQMFGWMKKRPARLNPESKWTIAVTDGLIAVSDEAGVTRSVTLDALAGVAIETNDTGPWGADVWWLLFG